MGSRRQDRGKRRRSDSARRARAASGSRHARPRGPRDAPREQRSGRPQASTWIALGLVGVGLLVGVIALSRSGGETESLPEQTVKRPSRRPHSKKSRGTRAASARKPKKASPRPKRIPAWMRHQQVCRKAVAKALSSGDLLASVVAHHQFRLSTQRLAQAPELRKALTEMAGLIDQKVGGLVSVAQTEIRKRIAAGNTAGAASDIEKLRQLGHPRLGGVIDALTRDLLAAGGQSQQPAQPIDWTARTVHPIASFEQATVLPRAAQSRVSWVQVPGQRGKRAGRWQATAGSKMSFLLFGGLPSSLAGYEAVRLRGRTSRRPTGPIELQIHFAAGGYLSTTLSPPKTRWTEVSLPLAKMRRVGDIAIFRELGSVRKEAARIERVSFNGRNNRYGLRWRVVPGKAWSLVAFYRVPSSLARFKSMHFYVRAPRPLGRPMHIYIGDAAGKHMSYTLRGIGPAWQLVQIDLASMSTDRAFDPGRLKHVTLGIHGAHKALELQLDSIYFHTAAAAPRTGGPIGPQLLAAGYRSGADKFLADESRLEQIQAPGATRGKAARWRFESSDEWHSLIVARKKLARDITGYKTLRLRLRSSVRSWRGLHVVLVSKGGSLQHRIPAGRITSAWTTVKIAIKRMSVLGSFDPRKMTWAYLMVSPKGIGDYFDIDRVTLDPAPPPDQQAVSLLSLSGKTELASLKPEKPAKLARVSVKGGKGHALRYTLPGGKETTALRINQTVPMNLASFKTLRARVRVVSGVVDNLGVAIYGGDGYLFGTIPMFRRSSSWADVALPLKEMKRHGKFDASEIYRVVLLAAQMKRRTVFEIADLSLDPTLASAKRGPVLISGFETPADVTNLTLLHSSATRVRRQGQNVLRWRVSAGKRFAVLLVRRGLPESLRPYTWLTFRMRVVSGGANTMFVYLSSRGKGRLRHTTRLGPAGKEWRTVRIRIDRMDRGEDGFDPDRLSSVILLVKARERRRTTVLIDDLRLEPSTLGGQGIAAARERAEKLPKPAAATRSTLVLSNGTALVGNHTQEAGKGISPEGKSYYIPWKRIAWFSWGAPAEALQEWWKVLASVKPAAASDDWLAMIKFILNQQLDRSMLRSAVARWRTVKQRETNSDWTVEITRNYVVCGQISAQRVRKYASYLELALTEYHRMLPSKNRPGLGFVATIYKWDWLYDRETGHSDSVGVYVSAKRELALRGNRPHEQIVSTLFHEAMHQYMHEYFAGYQTGYHWYSEGMADYFGTARVSGGAVHSVGAQDRQHVALIKRLLKRKRLREWLRFVLSIRDNYSKWGADVTSYAVSWLVVYALVNSRSPRVAKAWREWVRKQPDHDEKTETRLYARTIGSLGRESLVDYVMRYARQNF